MKLRKVYIVFLIPLLLTQCARNLKPHSNLEYSYARATAPFAAMSELAYKDKEDLDKTKPAERLQRIACRGFLENSGWKLEPDFCESIDEGKSGLQYVAWMNRTLTPNLLCVAFRGTEFLEEGKDMVANLHPLLGRLPGYDQYEHIEHSVLPAFERKYGKRIRDGDLVVITTGHSLGGGLAQNFMYQCHGKVFQAYVFDPSPVTAFTDLDEKSKEAFTELLPNEGFPDAQIVRVNQAGEILEPMRSVGSRFTYYTNQIDRITFDVSEYPGLFRRQAAFSRHSISGLAIGLMLRGGHPVDTMPTLHASQEPRHWHRPWWEKY